MDTIEDLCRDMVRWLGKATASLNEAERLLTAPDMGTAKWADELAGWIKTKRKLLNCQDE